MHSRKASVFFTVIVFAIATSLAHAAADVGAPGAGAGGGGAGGGGANVGGSECDPGGARDALPVSLQAGALIGLFLSSFTGALVPSICGSPAGRGRASGSTGGCRRSSRLRHCLDGALRVAGFAGSGVMLSTAFVHLLLPAQEALRSPCLPRRWLDAYPEAALLIALATVALAMVAEFFFEAAVLSRRGRRQQQQQQQRRRRQQHSARLPSYCAAAAPAAAAAAAAAVPETPPFRGGRGEASEGDKVPGAAVVGGEPPCDIESPPPAPAPPVAADAATLRFASGDAGAAPDKASPLENDGDGDDEDVEDSEEAAAAQAPTRTLAAAARAAAAAAAGGLRGPPLVPGLTAKAHEEGVAACCRRGTCRRSLGPKQRLLSLVGPLFRVGKGAASRSMSSSSGSSGSSSNRSSSSLGSKGQESAPGTSHPSSSSLAELAATECSICTHSVIIGAALGTTPGLPAFRSLLVALLFHQLLEGVALGSMAAAAGVGAGSLAPRAGEGEGGPARSRSRAAAAAAPIALAALFAASTPAGLAIGLAVRSGLLSSASALDPSASAAALLATGIADAVAAGTLLHLATGDHCANALRASAPWLRSRGAAMRVACVGAFLGGAALMAYIGVWA